MTTELHNWQDCIGDTINVRVTAKASSNRIKAEVLADGSVLVRVYVTVVAEAGKANEMVLKLLSKALGVPKSRLCIVKGLTSREKVIQVQKD